MQFKFFVGIDVSKHALDFSIVAEGKEVDSFRIENSARAIKAAIKNLKKDRWNFSFTRFILPGIYRDI